MRHLSLVVLQKVLRETERAIMRLSRRYIDWYREGIEIDRFLHWHDQVNSIAVNLIELMHYYLKLEIM